MNSLYAFLRKEWMEHIRSGRFMILLLIFILLGIMNPALAKMMPWILEKMADSLSSSGLTVTTVNVTALESWTQFFKNIPIGCIAFLLLESNIFTKEFESGTLILALTKGMDRYQVVVSKTILLSFLWSVCYWICFVITYSYNSYFWDNSVAQHLILSVVCWWIFGLWTISLLVLYSILSGSNSVVLLGTGCTILISYVLSLFLKTKKLLPTLLIDGNSLINGSSNISEYMIAIGSAIVISIACLFLSISLFNKKHL